MHAKEQAVFQKDAKLALDPRTAIVCSLLAAGYIVHKMRSPDFSLDARNSEFTITRYAGDVRKSPFTLLAICNLYRLFNPLAVEASLHWGIIRTLYM